MKHITIYITAALAAALAIGAMAGCSGQSASSSSASASSASAASSESASVSSESAVSSASASASASSSAAAVQSQDEIIAELKEAISKEPAYKSVTVTEVTKSTVKNSSEASTDDGSSEASADDNSSEASTDDSSASAASSEAASSESAAAEKSILESDVLEATTVYKFDASGDTLKTSMVGEMDDITIKYISDGDEAVCVTDGPIYGGTTEQFDLTHFGGVEAYLTGTFGDLNSIISCIDTVKKEQKGDKTVYALTLDPKKYTESDEALTILADSGETISKATLAIGFDKEGHIVSMDDMTEFKSSTSERSVTLTDFDSTTVDPMPEADKTYEDMEADMAQKLDTLDGEEEVVEDVEVIDDEVVEDVEVIDDEVVEDVEVIEDEVVDDGEGDGEEEPADADEAE